MIRLILAFFILSLAACEKKVEDTQRNLILDAMTTGQWKVSSYYMGAMNHTTDFDTYAFQFRENLTVEAIKAGSIEKTGTWNADPNARTITSNFPNSGEPLSLLNGTWTITNNSWTFVEAKQTVNGTMHTLRLDKL
jgi:hypothetical protein